MNIMKPLPIFQKTNSKGVLSFCKRDWQLLYEVFGKMAYFYFCALKIDFKEFSDVSKIMIVFDTLPNYMPLCFLLVF